MVDISVIIPTYNRSNLLKRALQSVVIQGGYTEIIVVDDASADDTKECVQSFDLSAGIIYVRQDKNCGVNAARNLAISRAKGEWIAVLDDDDEFLPDAIEKIKTYIKSVPDHINVLYFNSVIDNGISQVFGGFQFINDQTEYEPSYEETMIKFNLKGDSKPVFRRSLFNNHLYVFPESVNGYESYTMNLIARDGRGIRYINEISTLIHFDNSHQHISHTASRKNPKPLLDLHIRQLLEHADFYKKNPSRLTEKYLAMCKLAIRARNIPASFLYGFRSLLGKIHT